MIRAALDALVSATVLAFTVGAVLGLMFVLFGCSSPTAPTEWVDPYRDARPYLRDPNTVKEMLP